MNIQRALIRLKNFDTNFQALLEKSTTAAVVISGKSKIDGKPVEEVRETMKSDVQAINDTIMAKFNLKRAINTANNTVKVEVEGLGEVTLAEALIYRQTVLNLLEQTRDNMRRAANAARREFASSHASWVARKDEMVGTAPDEAAVAAIETLMAEQEPKLLTVESDLANIESRLSFLNDELDAILSEKNATSSID